MAAPQSFSQQAESVSGKPDQFNASLNTGRYAGLENQAQAVTQSNTDSPSTQEINTLAALFNGMRYNEAAALAQALTVRFPLHMIGWKALGVALNLMGHSADALVPMQKAASLAPEDAEAHCNLGAVLQGLGRMEDAMASYRQALRIKPDYAKAHGNMGTIYMGLARLDEAEACYRRVLQIKPDHAEAHFNLGNVLLNLGQLDKAEACCRQALQIKPNFAEAYYNLGVILAELERMDEAEANYRRVLEIKPDFAEAHCNLGILFAKQSRVAEAEANFRRALQIKPDYAEVHYNLGILFAEKGHLDEAETSYRQALKRKSDYAEVYYNLGILFAEKGRLEEAEANYRRALQIKPDFVEVHYNLGILLTEQSRLDEAEASYRRALQIKPDFVEVHYNLGILLAELGHLDEAEANYRQAVQIKPDYAEAHCRLVHIRKQSAGDGQLNELISIEETARNSGIPPSDKSSVYLHFALGKCYDDIGDYGKAFPHFIEGCRMRRATFEYNPELNTEYFSEVKRVFDRTTIERLRGGGDPSHVPIFVLGMPRSGTTLTEQIIASHPEVHGAGELPDLTAIAKRLIAGTTYPDNMLLLDPARLTDWGAEYVAGLQRRAPDNQRITDKMPGNFLAVGLIHLMLPNAKIIHVKRNPADTCLSCFNTIFTSGQEYSYDLSELGRYYADYARLMEHWRQVLPDSAFLEVQYEDIVADQEVQARRLIEYCGLAWDDACLDFHKNKRAVLTASASQVRRPLYRSSVERWRNYEQFLTPLLNELEELVDETPV